MKTDFGTKYDVSVDMLTGIILIYLLYTNFYKNYPFKLIVFILILLLQLILFSLKLNCIDSDRKLKLWEKGIKYIVNKIGLTCNKNLKYFLDMFDPGMNYLVFTLFLCYTLFIKTN